MAASAAAALDRRPVAGVDYPRTFAEFLDWFPDEGSCWSYLARLRWPDGFWCARCGARDAWLSDRYLYVCTECGRQTSITAGTIFHRTHLTLLTWFRAAWLVCGAKNGMSAKSLQTSLGLGSYRTAWTLLHKLRTVMVRPGRRGRGAAGKKIVAIAVEKPTGHVQHGFGRAPASA